MDIREFGPLHESLSDLAIDKTALHSTQCKCLTKYLTELGAKSLIVEEAYNDAGYLSEYSSYYSRCHDDYSRFTWRVHFFDKDADALSTLFDLSLICLPETDQEAQINGAYLGFVVVKPLPKTIIGRTCLRPYPETDETTGRTRHFPILREYGVLLYGLRLVVRSIAFQEQDNEVAACSTAAIWYALHSLIRKVTTEEIASTYEITNYASATYVKRSLGEVARRFPTSGLGLEQIEAYLRSIGMECIVCGAALDRTSAQAAEYLAAYASAGFPMILVGNLYVSQTANSQHKKLGLHAMTALGYADESDFKPGNRASRICRIFAHDDNVGPFTSYQLHSCEKGDFAKFINASPQQHAETERLADRLSLPKALPGQPTTVEQTITGFLSNESGLAGGGVGVVFRKFTPEYFIIPVAPKVRFPYEGIALFAAQVEQTYRTQAPLRYAPGSPPPKVSWSISLVDIKTFKSSLRRCVTMDQEAIIDVLLMALPKHIWVLSFWTKTSEAQNSPILDFLFDATSLRQSGGLIGQLPYDRLDEAETFMAIVTAYLLAYGEERISTMDSELQPIMRAAKQMIEDQVRIEAEIQKEAAGAN